MNFKLSKLLLLAAVIIISGVKLLLADNSAYATYGFYSETYAGLDYDSTVPTDPDRGMMMEWGDFETWTDYVNHTEGNEGLGFGTWGILGYGGFEICFGDESSWTITDRNMSSYTGGTIEFDIMLNNVSPFYTTPSIVQFQLEWNASGGVPAKSDVITLDQLNIAQNNNWQHCSIPLTTFKATNYNSTGKTWYFVNQPAGTGLDNGINHFDGIIFNVVSVSSAGFTLDNLVLKGPNTGSMYATLKNISDNSVATGFTWSNVALGSTKWKAADQYIQVQTDYYYPSGATDNQWGIEIYTDNENAGANPKYTGTGNPAGLVCQSTTTTTLPMCWRVVAMSTNTLTIVEGPAPYYNLYSQELGGPEGGFGFPCFMWMEDRNTPGFTDGGLAASNNYATVKDINGIQYAVNQWGGAPPPNYIYIGADFANATTPNTYTTNKLILELFHE